MIRKALIASIFLLPLSAATMPALAEDSEECTSEPRANWLSEAAAKAKAVEAGYEVRDLKTEGSCYEIYAVDKSGNRVEAVMNPASGAIVASDEGNE